MSIAVTVQYYSILRRTLGCEEQERRLPSGSSARDAYNRIPQTSGGPFHDVLFAARDDVGSHPIVFRNRKLPAQNLFDAQPSDGYELKLSAGLPGG